MSHVFKLLHYACPVLLAACASPHAPPGDGAVARAAFARQAIALPSAAPLSGIDGVAALQAQQAYRKSLIEREPAQRSLAIGLGAQK